MISLNLQPKVFEEIDALNGDSSIDAIIVLLPLVSDQPIDSNSILDRVLPQKDVDGLTSVNRGRLARGQLNDCVIPCAARGSFHLIETTGVNLSESHAVVLGGSTINLTIGIPAVSLFTWKCGLVTFCDPNVQDCREVSRSADILLTSTGVPEIVKGDWIKPGAVVIDAGFHVLKDLGVTGKGKYVGDVDFEDAAKVAGYISPVPGGTGPMTVAMLLRNTLDLAKKSRLVKV